jgi:hypothetical protein
MIVPALMEDPNMKKKSLLMVISGCLIILAACEEKPKEEPKEEPKPPPTIQEIAKTIFEAFKGDDFETLQAHFGSAEELTKLIAGLDATTDPEGKWAARRQSGLEQLITEPKRAWDKVLADAKVSGVNISRIALEDLRIERSKKGPIEIADVRLVIKSSRGFFRVKLDDWMKSSQGWLLFSEFEWQRPPPEPAPFYPGSRKPRSKDKAKK